MLEGAGRGERPDPLVLEVDPDQAGAPAGVRAAEQRGGGEAGVVGRRGRVGEATVPRGQAGLGPLPPPPEEVPHRPGGEAEGLAQLVGRRPAHVAPPQGLPDGQGDGSRHGGVLRNGMSGRPRTPRVCPIRQGGKRGLRDSRLNPPARDTERAPERAPRQTLVPPHGATLNPPGHAPLCPGHTRLNLWQTKEIILVLMPFRYVPLFRRWYPESRPPPLAALSDDGFRQGLALDRNRRKAVFPSRCPPRRLDFAHDARLKQPTL